MRAARRGLQSCSLEAYLRRAHPRNEDGARARYCLLSAVASASRTGAVANTEARREGQ